MKQPKKEPGKLKLLARYYKPYQGLFFADLFFAFLGAAVTLVIPLLVRYIMNTVGEMPAQEAKTNYPENRYRNAGIDPGTAGKPLFYHLLRTYDGRLH